MESDSIYRLPIDLWAVVFKFCQMPPRNVSIRVLALVCRRFHETVWKRVFQVSLFLTLRPKLLQKNKEINFFQLFFFFFFVLFVLSTGIWVRVWFVCYLCVLLWAALRSTVTNSPVVFFSSFFAFFRILKCLKRLWTNALRRTQCQQCVVSVGIF